MWRTPSDRQRHKILKLRRFPKPNLLAGGAFQPKAVFAQLLDERLMRLTFSVSDERRKSPWALPR